MKLDKTYTFPTQWKGVKFKNPTMTINPIVNGANPATMTIDVDITFIMDNKDISGNFAPDINPVPVKDLNYDTSKPQELIERVVTRLNDFKVK